MSTGFPFNVTDEPLASVTLFTLTVPVITALASATNSLIVPFAVIVISAARFTTLLKFPSSLTSWPAKTSAGISTVSKPPPVSSLVTSIAPLSSTVTDTEVLPVARIRT
ncbi:hypothetical protein D3C80_1889800 [compost metagenome]